MVLLRQTLLKLTPGLGMKVSKTGEERRLVIFTDTFMNDNNNEELSTRPFHWYAWLKI